jgi:glycosyltransferase 2 family protein
MTAEPNKEVSAPPSAREGKDTPEGSTSGRVFRVIRAVLPIVLIVLIVAGVDLRQVGQLAADAHLGWLFLGIVFTPSRILAAAARWFIMLRAAFGRRVHWLRTLHHYWTGVALGFFTPASAGLEIYRVVAVTREVGHPRVNVAIVVLEKVLALVGCALTALVALPFLPAVTGESASAVRDLAWLAVGLLGVGLIVTLTARHMLGSRLVRSLSRRADALLIRVRPRLSSGPSSHGAETTAEGLRSVTHPMPLAGAFAASVGVQVSAAIGGQIMFHAVGYEVPFAVNLFVIPILYVLFALPISIGSIGVREGGYILLYGMFGVPAEVALLVSLLTLLGIGLNSLIGSAMIWTHKRRVDAPADAAS